jgi:hypothetical protein
MKNPPCVYSEGGHHCHCGCCPELDEKPLLIFGVREGVVVHAIIIPVGFIAPWCPVIIVVRFNKYKTFSVKKEMICCHVAHCWWWSGSCSLELI